MTSAVLVLAVGSSWEGETIATLPRRGFPILKRCVDVPDLMASAQAGGAALALVDGDVAGLDAEVVIHLLRYDVRTVVVSSGASIRQRVDRMGVAAVVAPDAADIVPALDAVMAADLVADPDPPEVETPAPGRRGRVLAVWGPSGAPGRTTVAIGLAAELAASGTCVLVDADPLGGAVAQHLGVLDEVSGVLAAARLANAGRLDAAAFATCARRVGKDGPTLLTGLPRADRRIEVRAGAIERVLETAALFGDVVVDCGFGIEDDDLSWGRDRMTLDVLGAADEVIVVGSAEPTGLARLARGLVELGNVVTGVRLHVVVNRMRPSLGWSERDIAGMVEGYVRPAGLHFLPVDQPTLDRALVAGTTLVELGDSPLRRALATLAGAVGAQPSSSQRPVEV